MRYKEDRSVSARGGQQGVCDVERVKRAALCAAMASAGETEGAAVMPAPRPRTRKFGAVLAQLLLPSAGGIEA